MSLVKDLNIVLADLLPVHGVQVAIQGETIPYRMSQRLHDAMKARALEEGVPVSTLVRLLREELNSASVASPNVFLRELQELGVQISGLDPLQAILAESADWRDEFAQLALKGRKQGIRFFFARPDLVTNEVTLRIVELADSFGFTPQQRRFLVQNIVVAASR